MVTDIGHVRLSSEYSSEPRLSQDFFNQMSILSWERSDFSNVLLSLMDDEYNQIRGRDKPILLAPAGIERESVSRHVKC